MPNLDQLVRIAAETRANAYAPYSVYQVGAAVLGADGKVYAGCNVENVSFGLTLCAERVAVAAMVSGGCRTLRAVALATKDGGTPCGMCLQTFLEFSDAPEAVPVVCQAEGGERKEYNLSELLPHGFQSRDVRGAW